MKDVCSSEDEVLAAGPWREGDEEEDDFIMIPETVTSRSGRVASKGFNCYSPLILKRYIRFLPG